MKTLRNTLNFLSSARSPLLMGTAMAAAALSANDTASAQTATVDYNKLGLRMMPETATNADQNPAHTVHNFNIPAGKLPEALAAFEKETGLKVSMPGKDISGVESKGVTGVLTVEEGLTQILDGTGLAANLQSGGLVELKLKSADQTVTVTADGPTSIKYTAPLRDLPQTITVIPQEVLQTTASTSLTEALRTVSGITFGAGEGGNPIGDRPFIRGTDAQSSTFVDGMRDIGSQSREVFNLESIEVSKGPSGTFAGRGASGGSLNLNTKMARRERFVSGSFSPGNGSFYRGTVDANSKLGDYAAGRINGLWHSAGVAGRDVVKSDRWGVAPAVTLNPNKRTTLNLNYYHLMSNDIPDPGMPYNNPTPYWTGTNAATTRTDGRKQVLQPGDGSPLVVNRNAFYGNTNRDFRIEKVKTGLARVQVSLWEGAVLRNTYRYGKSQQDYIYSQADDSQGNIYYGLVFLRNLNRNTRVDTSIDQTDLAGSGKTGSVRHTYATGMEFSRERGWNSSYGITLPAVTIGQNVTVAASRCPVGPGAASNYNCVDLFNPAPEYNDPWRSVNTINRATPNVTNLIFPTNARTTTRSLYAFDTMQLHPKLMATVGIRYDHYNSKYRGNENVLPSATVVRTGRIDDLVNYQGALNYKPMTKVSIYGSVSSSSVPVGNALLQGSDPNALSTTTNQNLAPEKTRSVEAGVKYELFNGRALATGAFFQQNVDNARVTADASGTIQMAGKKRNRGIDVGLSGNVTRNLSVFGGYTFMNAILVDNGVVVTNGVASPSPLNGRRFPNTPEHSFSVTSYYQVTPALKVGGGLYGAGKVFGADNPTSAYTMKWVPSYTRVDLFGSYRVNKNFEVQGNLLNVGDKIYFLQAYPTHYAQMAPGRTARLTLNVRF